MRKLMLIFIFCLAFNPIYSQGFDWVYNMRMPFHTPDLYIGIGSSFKNESLSGNFNFLDNQIFCCNYTGGSGSALSFNLVAEYWLDEYSSVVGKVRYDNSNINYTALSSLPVSESIIWTTEFNSNLNLQQLGLYASYKRRVYQFLSLGAGTNLFINSTQTLQSTEKVVSPQIPFSDGSFQREIANGSIDFSSNLTISPFLGIYYDIAVANSLYATIFFEYRFYTFGLNENRNMQSTEVGINLLYGEWFRKY